MKFYHGSNQAVEKPDIYHSRINIDFGSGFYVTLDSEMAKRWACNKNTSIVTEYEIADKDFEQLSIYHFSLNEEWLYFVIQNRNDYEVDFPFSKYDVLCGPVADDKMFRTIQEFEDGEISAKEAIKVLTIAGHSEQYNFRTDKGVKCLKYHASREYSQAERDMIRGQIAADRMKMKDRILEIRGNSRPKFRPRRGRR